MEKYGVVDTKLKIEALGKNCRVLFNNIKSSIADAMKKTTKIKIKALLT